MNAGRRHIGSYMKRFRNEYRRYVPLLILLFVLLSLGIGILRGAQDIAIGDLLAALSDTTRLTPAARILWYVRFPRVGAAFVCGAALAVSGAVIQCVLANPLASPGMIGVNAGAGLAVTLCAAFGILGGWQLSLYAFLGAFLTSLIVSSAANRFGASGGVVILLGAALNSLLGAFSDTVVNLFPDVSIMNNAFRAGDFSAVTTQRLIPAAVVIVLTVLVLLFLTHELDILTLGDESARGLGVRTGLMRVVFLLLSALLAGAAVSIAGLLSFVGLLVPHAVRRIIGSGTKYLIPCCALIGGAFCVLCDTAARVLFAPYELPVGILMAFIGAPFFLYLLLSRKAGGMYD